MVGVIGNKNTQETEEGNSREKMKENKTNMKKKKKRKREISRIENRECFGEITRIFKKRERDRQRNRDKSYYVRVVVGVIAGLLNNGSTPCILLLCNPKEKRKKERKDRISNALTQQ